MTATKTTIETTPTTTARPAPARPAVTALTDPAADAARFPAIMLANEGEWARLDLGGAGEGPATPP